MADNGVWIYSIEERKLYIGSGYVPGRTTAHAQLLAKSGAKGACCGGGFNNLGAAFPTITYVSGTLNGIPSAAASILVGDRGNIDYSAQVTNLFVSRNYTRVDN